MLVCIDVENIKCGGCANQISKKLMMTPDVLNTHVDVETGVVSVEVTDDETLLRVKKLLASLGYPEVGSIDGIAAAGAKAKSYVSCAIGKVTKE